MQTNMVFTTLLLKGQWEKKTIAVGEICPVRNIYLNVICGEGKNICMIKLLINSTLDFTLPWCENKLRIPNTIFVFLFFVFFPPLR